MSVSAFMNVIQKVGCQRDGDFLTKGLPLLFNTKSMIFRETNFQFFFVNQVEYNNKRLLKRLLNKVLDRQTNDSKREISQKSFKILDANWPNVDFKRFFLVFYVPMVHSLTDFNSKCCAFNLMTHIFTDLTLITSHIMSSVG